MYQDRERKIEKKKERKREREKKEGNINLHDNFEVSVHRNVWHV